MIDLFKDLVDMLPIKFYVVKEYVVGFLSSFISVTRGFIIFCSFVCIFNSLLGFIYYAFYSQSAWCLVYLIAMPILTWVNMKM